MHQIEYRDYLNKVYGCWMGKCVAGTIGAPFEGAKELFDFEYEPSLIENMLPNDDLDLQVLWLSVIEKKGIHFTSEDLADAFLHKCPYAPGEYAIFKKNYARGIRPPVSGEFNNHYYIEGMGCPIRSEIWGCIAPGNPEMAAEFASRDGIMDHSGNSVFAEQFLAAVEAAAFFERDMDKLVEIGLSVIPEESKIARLIRNVRSWCKSSSDWRYVRSKVIRHYGHPDCTNMFQNIGITLLSLYFGEMDLIKTTMTALNCGFDTDCTCATAGAILGIMEGGETLSRKFGFKDQGFVLGVDAPRRSDRIYDLAEDTCLMGVYFARELNNKVLITNAPEPPAIEAPAVTPVFISMRYEGIPAVGVGDTRRVRFHLQNNTGSALSGDLSIDVPEGWKAEPALTSVVLPENKEIVHEVDITVPEDIEMLQETNICRLSFKGVDGTTVDYSFGLAGAALWQVYGPFWENCIKMPRLNIKENYYKYITGSNDNEYIDNVRTYHLNTRVDLEKEYVSLDELLNGPSSDDACSEGMLFNCYEDKFSVNDVIGFQGPCVVYMVRRMICPEDREVGIQIGHTDAYSLWINGEPVSSRDNVDWWTAENAHINKFPLKKGLNTIVLRLVRRSDKADFSLVFSKGCSCSEHYIDCASLNPNSVTAKAHLS